MTLILTAHSAAASTCLPASVPAVAARYYYLYEITNGITMLSVTLSGPTYS